MLIRSEYTSGILNSIEKEEFSSTKLPLKMYKRGIAKRRVLHHVYA
jgi:hypothetical protein